MSAFSTSSCSSSSSSNFGPSTPYASSSTSSRRRPSSEDDHSIITPPGSLRDYSASLKASHTLGMAAAMKSIPLEREPRRCEFGGPTANPFDDIYHSPTPAVKVASRRSAGEGMKEASRAGAVQVGGGSKKRYSGPLKSPDPDVPPFKPALINFHRNFSDETTITPGSVASEASFEASTPDDYFRVYGRPIPSYSPIDLSAYIHDESQTRPSSHSDMIPLDAESESPFEHPTNRLSTISSTTESTITSLSSNNTITSLPSPTYSPTLAQIGVVAGTARMSRPSLLRPRPRKHPYENTSGGRQRENSGGRGMSFGKEEEEMKQDGRSVSEMMVAMAGLRCQRGRAVRG